MPTYEYTSHIGNLTCSLNDSVLEVQTASNIPTKPLVSRDQGTQRSTRKFAPANRMNQTNGVYVIGRPTV